MNSFAAFLALAMVTLAVAELPSPYQYNRPLGGAGSAGSASSLGGSFASLGGNGFSGGVDTNEGANVDPQLLQQVREILLREESQQSLSVAGAGSLGAPSGQYGAPAPVYGAPAQRARVVDVQLEHTIPAVQVAAFSQQSVAQVPQTSYGAPSNVQPQAVYGAPSNQQASVQGPY